MKNVLLAALAGLVLFAVSCKNGGGDPKVVLSGFFDALSKADMAKARTFATEDSKGLLDMMEMAMKTDKSETEKFNPKNMEFGVAKIEGDKAIVPVKEITSGETLNYTLKKEAGDWKVAFDKNTLMTMGMENLNKKGMTDSVTNVLDELKHLDTDSLKASMEDRLKTLDSARKEMQK